MTPLILKRGSLSRPSGWQIAEIVRAAGLEPQ
jgi:hypothetical protein